MAAEPPFVHLLLEEPGGLVDERLEGHSEVGRERAVAVERLAPHEAHEIGVLDEEPEGGGEHVVDLGPAVDGRLDGLGHPPEPVDEV